MHSNKKLCVVFLLSVVFPVLLLLIMFWEPLSTGQRIFHLDWAPYFEEGFGSGFWRIFVEIGRTPGFMAYMWALLPDRVFHALFYPVMIFSIWAVLYFFFRNRRLPHMAALAGALAGAFAGYYITLISAGHRNVYEAILSSVIILLCVDGVVRGGSVWYGVAAALATAFTLGSQPDVLGIIGMFLVFYALLACWWGRNEIIANKKRFALSLIISGVVFGVAVLPAAHKIYTSTLPGREAQISQSASAGADGAEAASASKRWEFTTNWSLPLADAPEFILPLFFGTEATDQSAPFWGELGRSLDWAPGKPGFRNFRQHTIYMGIIQVLLALFAFGCVLNKKCRQNVFQFKDERLQVIFWGICAIIALLLSFGRYTPFYRLFYVLPVANAIRAPVKFLHVVNIAVAILTAYGVTFLLWAFSEDKEARETREVAQKAAKWLAIGAGGLAAVLVLVAVVTWAASSSIAVGWSQMGFDESLHPAMRRHMFVALWRSIGLSAGFAGCLYFCILRRKVPAWSATAFGVLLCVAIGLDMSMTARRFVNTADMSIHESANAIVNDIEEDVAPRVFDMLTSRQAHDPLRANFRSYHAASVRLLDDELPNDGELLRSVGNDLNRLVRLLQVTGTEYVMGPREQLVPWVQHPSFSVESEYDFAQRIVRAGGQRQGGIVLLQVAQVLPRAAWMPAMRWVAEEDIKNELFAEHFDPRRELLVTGLDPSRPVTFPQDEIVPAKISEWSRWRVVLDHVPREGGVLLLNEPYHAHWKAYVDGAEIPVRLANGVMMAVSVAEGTKVVVFLRHRGAGVFYISTLFSFGLLVLLGSRIVIGVGVTLNMWRWPNAK